MKQKKHERITLLIGISMFLCGIVSSVTQDFPEFETFTTVVSVVMIALFILFAFLCYKNKP